MNRLADRLPGRNRQRWLLRGLRVWNGIAESSGDLRLRAGRIVDSGPGLAAQKGERTLELSGHLALPGLINAHDHLSLNLLPRLGSPPWPNSYAWAKAIHHPEGTPIREWQRVPMHERLLWGGYRNLFAGVTTVCHHDPDDASLRAAFPVRVPGRVAWAHSLGVSGPAAVKRAYRQARGRPFVIHAAEGVDAIAAREVGQLELLEVLRPNTILVHATALSDEDIRRVVRAGVGVIWCPASARFLYGRCADLRRLRERVPLALGTDSTLSGSVDMLSELRVALESGIAAPDELLGMVGIQAARLLGLREGEGTLLPGARGDMLVIPDTGGSVGTVLTRATLPDVSLVLVGGRARLATPDLAAALGTGNPNIRIAGAKRWAVGDPLALRERIAAAVGTTPPWEHDGFWPLLRRA
jgi:cytosine/adenosine deaminase-related metal-dependent hydrolase